MQTIEQNPNESVKPLNIWKSIWFHPRKTVQYALEHKSGMFVLFIAMLAGVFHTLDQASSKDMGDIMNVWFIILLAIMLGPIAGIVSLYIGSGILHLFAMMFGGRGNFTATKMAFTVSNIILIILGFVWIPDLIIIGKGMFVSDYDFSIFQFLWLLVSLFLNLALAIWSMVAMIAALAEVHYFAIWKAVLVVFLPIIILTVIIVSIVMLTIPFSL